jgi:hypothetical protein
MSKKEETNKKLIIEVPNKQGGSEVQLESKGGAIPPTKVSVVMPPVKKPKE